MQADNVTAKSTDLYPWNLTKDEHGDPVTRAADMTAVPIVVWLNGSINAGKSTAAALLVSQIDRAVHIEVDHLPTITETHSLEEAIPILLDDVIALTRNWIGRGFNLIITWPISETDFARFSKSVAELGVPLHAFTLSPRIDVARSSRGDRELTAWEQRRIDYHYANGINCPTFGTIIDNSDEPPQATAQRILEQLRKTTSDTGLRQRRASPPAKRS